MQHRFNKQKLIEILITALLSAGIAFLQSLLLPTTGLSAQETSPILAGAVGALIKGCRV